MNGLKEAIILDLILFILGVVPIIILTMTR